ncbi:uncharacterized protein CIMG_05235 [Coccidioides immitis RS]|uniref:Uncharacterized protein n=1 Tax=Coccidioides immitis (strain RS) TaxID=246410 RepID=J3KF52_COCIM|nr:uncharacterized protein CIMG_05235 [Coccidioides immitis RS]EAS34211.3 hypothetical protein CIMG_05235 [Coccidioides immitis RS]
MCQIITEEIYSTCGHAVECHLKHGLIYCDAPNDIPFRNNTREERQKMYPNRFCSEEDWMELSADQNGLCPDCKRKKEKKPVAGVMRSFGCGHSRVSMIGHMLQCCFSPVRPEHHPEKNNGRGVRDKAGKSSASAFSATFSKSLLVDISRHLRLRPPRSSGVWAEVSGKVGSAAAGTGQNESSPPQDGHNGAGPEEAEIRGFHAECKNREFSWKKFQKLRMMGNETGVWCPNCERAKTKMIMKLHEFQNAASGETEGGKKEESGYRAKKPKGLTLFIRDDKYFWPEAVAVRGQIEQEGKGDEE